MLVVLELLDKAIQVAVAQLMAVHIEMVAVVGVLVLRVLLEPEMVAELQIGLVPVA